MTSQKKKSKRLVLLDAHAILHRAYHALPEFASNRGEPTGALYGLSAMLVKLIQDLKPDYIIACYDMPGPTFRHEAYEAYKAKRPKTKDDLIAQMNRSRDIFRAFNIPIYEKAGFEADDIIGTIVEETKKEVASETLEVVIASGDMDTLQLVLGESVRVYTLKKGLNDTILYGEKAVQERFGFSPRLLPDYKGLRGDPSDNIIGIQGIGEKTATTLITSFGSIEDIYKKLKKKPDEIKKVGITERILKLLQENEEEALFSKALATIKRDVPIDFSLPKAEWEDTFDEKIVEKLFRELNFRSLFERVKKLSPEDDNERQGGEVEIDGKKDTVNKKEMEEVKIALWLTNSDITRPEEEDILAVSEEHSFPASKKNLLETLKKHNLLKVYNTVELPLVPIIQKMEERGVCIDTEHLKTLSSKFHVQLEKLEKEIWKEAGVEFNINSPKQLGEILFDRLGLSQKGLKKTEGGARSTRESELEKLRGVHPIIEHLFAQREIQKLVSTYVDTIPHMVQSDGRLHTTFVQTGTTTGRLSSINPNLQNIPIKSAHGMEIRKAFVAESGHVLLAFDYSQIELRMFALISGDKDFIHVFEDGRDIHSAVASEVFGVPEKEVTSDMRRRAKVINFGILYGMGVSSLQKSLQGTREEAERFYDKYLNEFSGIRDYIARIKSETAKKGYTETLFGRRRYFEGMRSHIPYVRAGAERMAINAPLQGSAADVIKLAMIKAERALGEANVLNRAHLILQVHDELVYEVEEDEEARARTLIKGAMENVLRGEDLKIAAGHIPLKVNVEKGKTWGNMEKVE